MIFCNKLTMFRCVMVKMSAKTCFKSLFWNFYQLKLLN